MTNAIARALDRGDQVFWVCPMASENMLVDAAAAEARFRVLRLRFGEGVGLAHGQLDTELRERALREFAAGEKRLLVATTVIEVGPRQSGQPGWRLADPVEHDGLLQMASKDAAHLLERDPKLESGRGHAIRLLLRMFKRGAALRTLASG